MKRRPTRAQISRELHAAGVRYYDTPTITQHPKEGKRWKYADAWQADRMNPAALSPIIAKFSPWLHTGRSVSQYAPEQVRPVLMLLTARALNKQTTNTP